MTEMPRLKNCWECDISSGCTSLSEEGGGGGGKARTSAEGARFLGDSGGMLPQKIFENLSL